MKKLLLITGTFFALLLSQSLSQDWHPIKVQPSPGENYSMSNIGDDKVLLVGGQSKVETWIYDLIEDTWTQDGDGISPPVQDYYSIAYLGDDKVLMFVGSIYGEENVETWIYDLSDGNWIQDSKNSQLKNSPVLIGNGTDWKQIAGGDKYTIAIKEDGTLWAWGDNSYGRLGDGTTSNKTSPVQIRSGTDWKQVSSGSAHSLAIKENGTLWAWGHNYSGQLGDGTTIQRLSPVQIGSDTDWKQVVCGSTYTLAIKQDGTLWAWGYNYYGQLGDGTTTQRTSPVQIASETKWKMVTAAQYHTLAIKEDGTLWGWGFNYSGQLGDGTTTDKLSPVQIGSSTDWKQIACGNYHSLAIKENGTLWAWGSNGNCQLGDGTTIKRISPIQIGTGTCWKEVANGTNDFSLAISENGTLWGWGYNSNGQLGDGSRINRYSPTQIGTSTNWKQVLSVNLALKENGTLWGWGSYSSQFGITTDLPSPRTKNSLSYIGDDKVILFGGELYGEYLNDTWIYDLSDGTWTQDFKNTILIRNPEQIDNSFDWKQVSSGSQHSLAIKTDGTLWAWGNNSDGQLGDETTTQRNSPGRVGNATNWKLVACESRHSLAIKADGTLWGWGNNYSGQLGDGTTTNRTSPVQIGTESVWKQIACGPSYSMAIKEDGTLWAWGYNYYGQLGDGTTIQRNSPVQIGSEANWKSVTCGYGHTLAIKDDGTLWAWGYNIYGQLGDETNTDKTSPVQIGTGTIWKQASIAAYHSMAIKEDGTLWVWGNNGDGQLGDGTRIAKNYPVQIRSETNWKVVECESDYALAIKTDGTLWGWGRNSYCQLGDGTTLKREIPVQIGNFTNWNSIACGYQHTLGIRNDGTLWSWGYNDNSQLGNGKNLPSPRSGSPMAYIVDDRVIIYGGGSRSINNETWIYDLSDASWTKVAEGTSPEARYHHSLTYLGNNKVLMFGGATSGGENNETWIYDLSEDAWTQYAGGIYPSARTDHYMAYIGDDKVLMFGGREMSRSTYNNETWIFDLSEWRWYQGVGGISSPSGRFEHSMAYIGENKLLIFGGYDVQGLSNNETLIFDISNQTWTPDATGTTPSARYGHSMAFIGDDKVLMFGGYTSVSENNETWIYDLSEGTWTQDMDGNSPTARYDHAMAYIGDDKVLMFGGQDDTGINNETWIYDLGNGTWTQDADGISPPARSNHAITYIGNNKVMMFGGETDDALNSTWIYDLSNGNWTMDEKNVSMKINPVQIISETNWKQVAGGDNHTMAIKENGTLWAWGDNSSGQLGDGTSTYRKSPVQIGSGTDWKQVVCGLSYTLAIKEDGTLWAWGHNYNGNLGDGTTIQRLSPVQIGSDTDWKQVTCGSNHTLAIKNDGTLWAWGYNYNGILGDGTKIQRISPVQIGINTNWKQVACGYNHNLAIMQDGTLWAWGENGTGQLGDGTTTSKTIPIQIGSGTDWNYIECAGYYSFGIKVDGSLWAWGNNSYGRLGDGSTTNRTTPVQIGNETNWKQVACGYSHTIAIKQDGTLWGWGYNSSGQLGDGTRTDRTSPVKIGNGTEWEKVSCGNTHTLSIKLDGSLWAWGYNRYGEIGDGSLTPFGLSDHSMANIGGDKVLMFGCFRSRNYGETWIYDITNESWTQDVIGTTPYSETGHSMSYIGDDKVLLYGGENDYIPSDEIWIYDLSEETWSQMQKEDFPSDCNNQKIAYIGDDKALMFDGGSSNIWVSTWVYDFSEGNWTMAGEGTGPSQRNFFSTAYIGDDKVLLFGGSSINNVNTRNNETWIYDLSDKTWIRDASGVFPSARSNHSMAYLGDDKVLMFGGSTSVGKSNETWIYDLSDGNWAQIVTGIAPSAREGQSMTYIGDDKVIMFGGSTSVGNSNETWIYDLSEGSWTQDASGIYPSSRNDHSMAYMGDDKVLMFGGSTGSGSGNDTWIYDLSEGSWIQDVCGVSPPARYRHTMSYIGDYKVLMTGGGNNDYWYYSATSAPIITTSPVSEYTTNIAICGGNLSTGDGTAVTSRGVVWSTTPNPELGVNELGHTSDGSGVGEFMSNITGLSPGTKYYVRAYATTDVNFQACNEITFTTIRNNLPPVVDATPSEINIYLGQNTTLTATATDPDNDPVMFYKWSIVSAPPGSGLSGVVGNSVELLFTPDVAGDFVLAIKASDESLWSDPDIVTVQVTECSVTCGMVLTCNATLTEDLDCSGYTDGPAITIGADNITLDLNGHTITAAPGQVGVSIGGSNVTITSSQPGGKIDGSGDAIYFGNCSNVTISNLDLSLPEGSTPSGNGFANYHASISNVTIENVTVNRRHYGVRLFSSGTTNNLKIINSNFDYNNYGMSLLNIENVNLSNLSIQNCLQVGFWPGNLFGDILIAGVNVAGCSNGVVISDQTSVFPVINSNMFTGFGSIPGEAFMFSGICENLTLSDIDLSWTGEGSKIGYGITSNWGSGNNLTLENITINNRYRGLSLSGNQSYGVHIINSTFDNNERALNLININGLELTDLSVKNNAVASIFTNISGEIDISNVNLAGSNIGILFQDQPSGFPTIVPGMFDGFGSVETTIYITGELTAGISLLSVDLSWTLNEEKTGYGIYCMKVDGLSFSGVIINNRYYAIDFVGYGQSISKNIEIKNSTIDENMIALNLVNLENYLMSNLSLQNNENAIWFNKGITGTYSSSNVNLAGSVKGLVFRNGFAGYPAISSGMFTGFGRVYDAVWIMGGTSSGITLQGIDLSWTGSMTPTGHGIFMDGSYGGWTENLTINGVTANNREAGVTTWPHEDMPNTSITNSTFDNCTYGMYLYRLNGLNLSAVSLQNNSTGVQFGLTTGSISISDVNVAGCNTGIVLDRIPSGFPTINPGAFTGFTTVRDYPIFFSNTYSTDVRIKDVDLSWTGNTTPNGIGIWIPGSYNSAVENLTIENVSVHNREAGFSNASAVPSKNLEIKNSNFDNNMYGVYCDNINGLKLSSNTAQNNQWTAIVINNVNGDIYLSDNNVAGSEHGVALGSLQPGFPAIVPGMFTGFGSCRNTSIVFAWGTVYGMTLSGIDLSWTGSSNKTGCGIKVVQGCRVDNLTITNVIVQDREVGFSNASVSPGTNIEIMNSTFNQNNNGLYLTSIDGLNVHENNVKENGTSLTLGSVTNHNIHHNNICSNSGYAVVGDGPYELWNHTTMEGNYWCVTCNDMGFIPGTTSSRSDIIDNYAYGTESGWLLPASNPDSKPCQKAPIADAGPAEITVLLGSSVTLEGTATDPNGDPIIQYEWSVVTAPASSAFTGVISAIASFSFTPDVAGEFVLAFRAYDGYGWSEPDQINVHCISNRPPVAICQNITLPADENCMADALINNGSYDPDEGDQITLTQNPAGPYPLGNTTVTLTVTDSKGLSSLCEGIVTVQDVTAPVISCIGTDQNIIPSDGLCSYTHSGTSWDATATDNCSESIALSYTLSGATTGSGSTLAGVILNPGTTLVTWTAEDEAGNTSQSSFNVIVGYNTALIYVYGALHTTGSGRTPVTSKTALLLDLKIFDKTGISPDPRDFELIWNTYQALPTSVISISEPVQCSLGGGSAYKYTLTVPSSNCISSNGYLIIGKAVVDGIAIYTGSPVGEMNTGSTSNKYLQVIKNANGKKAPAITSVVNGSLLLIAEPEYIEFTESEELFPVICESVDGNWSIQVNVEPPEGFTSTPGALNTDVNTSNINTVQFTIKDIGSKWTHTKVKHKIKHKGKESEITTMAGMIDKQKKKKEVEDYEQETTSFVDELSVRLKQNYPNPFAQLTEIQYFVSQREHATLVLTDINGRVVANLIDKYVSPGWNTLIVNGSGLTAGTYILRLESMGKAAMMKIVKMD